MCPENMISFRVVWNKKNYDITFNANDTVANLKKHIESLTGWRSFQILFYQLAKISALIVKYCFPSLALPVTMQKLMFKGKIIIYFLSKIVADVS